jgi:hypothetical protein
MAYSPIRSPLYLEATPWPYIKGPNYTRPVFAEHSRQGNFAAQPLLRMEGFGGDPQSVLAGLGKVEIPPTCWDAPGFKTSHDACLVAAQQKCDFAEPCTTQEHEGCLTRLVASSNCKAPSVVEDAMPMEGSWYTNPYYLGLGAVVTVLVLSLLNSQE